MSKGIVLYAFGRRGYGYAAYNLAVSIKHFNSDIKISVFLDEATKPHLQDLTVFDSVHDLQNVKTNGRIDPALVKTGLYDSLPYNENLYLDVDAVILKDITPLLEQLSDTEGYYLTDVIDQGTKDAVINYNIWADNEDIWDFYKLDDGAILPAIQSSWAYIKKCRESEVFFKTVKRNYNLNFPLNKLTMNWGGTMPDELLFSATCAQVGISPRVNVKPIFFGNKYSEESYSELREKYYILSIYGNGKGKTLTKYRYINWYDKLMVEYMKSRKQNHVYKSNYILNDKHANFI